MKSLVGRPTRSGHFNRILNVHGNQLQTERVLTDVVNTVVREIPRARRVLLGSHVNIHLGAVTHGALFFFPFFDGFRFQRYARAFQGGKSQSRIRAPYRQ